MYEVYCDGTKIYDLYTELYLIEPVLELELNSPGTFEFTMPSDHPYFDLPQKMLSRVTVKHDDEEIFCGRVINEEIDFYNQKKVYCEGELAFLNDSIQRPAEYHDLSVRDYFKILIDNHNAQVEADKQFEIGYVLISDDNDSLYRYTNYNSTLEEMKEDLVDDYGGYIRVRNENGHRYLDYIDIDNYAERNDQAIRFGVNLLDYTQTMDVTDIATVIIPLGARLDESPIEALDMRLTIEDVNKGSDAIESEEAVKTYGRIVKTIIWDDITQASNLLTKGQKYLSDYQWDPLVLEVSPIDLHDTDPDTETFHLGDQLRVVSSPHGLDRYFPISAMTIHLDSLDKNTFTLGTVIEGETLTQKIRATSDDIKKVDEKSTPTQAILNQAKEQATALITSATHGYIVIQPNEGPYEILIMDAPDYEDSLRVWRWNLNGLGYASRKQKTDEYEFGLAMTMDGAIVADYITTGTLTANIIRTGKIQDVPGNNCWDMDNGTLTIDTQQFTLDSKGNAVFKGSLSAASGTFTYLYTGSHSSFESTANGFYAGGLGMSLGEYFEVTTSGLLSCSYATVYGSLSCQSLFSRNDYEIKITEMSIFFYNDYSSDPLAQIQLKANPSIDIEAYDGAGIELFSNTKTYSGTSGRAYGIEIYVNETYSINMYGRIEMHAAVLMDSSLTVSGTKSRIIDTEHYDTVTLYSFETASPMFGDSGSGTIGEDGKISIFIDPDFYETVDQNDYQVFLTNTAPGKIDWVDKKDGYFDVYGDAGETFDWIIMAHQRDATITRLEQFVDKPTRKERAE